MGEISTVNHYYNLYDSTKGYTELLFRAGKVLQSKELNELQSMLKNQIKNVGDTLLTNGDIIEGCQLVIDGTNVTITDGKIYLNGDVRKIPKTTIQIAAEGQEIIGAIVRQEVITTDDDNGLRDVASGYDNYAQDGAFRMKETVEITVNNPDAAILYTLTNGQQLSAPVTEDLSQIDKFQATLARRTYDESGNYKVNGLKLVDKQHNDANNIYISLESGKAYVRGYEVVKSASQAIALKRAKTLRDIENEPKIYRSANRRYALNNDYVNVINKIVSIVRAEYDITRGSIIGGVDYLPLSPVAEIISVKQGGTTFTQGVDYQLTNDGVDWSLGGNAPDPGSTYKVVWSYNKNMVPEVDYTLYLPSDSTLGYVEFLNGDKPMEGTTFLVNYNFMLCRRDSIALDRDGGIIVVEGQPDILRTVESPSVDTSNVLVLGSVLLKPRSNDVIILNNNTQTIPMLDLYKMLERINALEYNQSITDLDNEAAAGENATELIGVLTDGFLGLSKSDVYHREFNATVDLDNQELCLPFTTSVSNLTVNKDNDYKAGTFGRLLTNPYTETTLYSQTLATNAMRINSYNAFPKTPVVKISPESDNWIDEREITVEGETVTVAVALRRWWYHKNESWAQEEKALWQSYGLADGGQSLGWNSAQVTTTKSVMSGILDSLILYMRQMSINVTVYNMEPFADNIVATFDDMAITLDPQTTAYKGTKPGSLRADVNGQARGHFIIPAKTLCGVKELKVYPEDKPYMVGRANYTANGRIREYVTTIWKEVTNLMPWDPLAQSFQFDLDQFVTGIGIYFLNKDETENITVQLRNMVNGYPGNKVYAEKVIVGNTIATSTDASVETKVVFDDPVYCNANEQYCFTVMSNSDFDSLWIAETGRENLATGVTLTKNPYLNGTMFSSSNAMTWTAHQASDLKFKVYGAVFQTTGHAIFNSIDEVSFDRLMIVSEESIPAGCKVEWKYAINGGDWRPIETYDDRDIDEVAHSVDVRVDLTGNSFTSPAIALDSLLLAGFTNAGKGTYISKNVTVTEGFNNVKQIVDLHIPNNTNVNMYYATDTSGDNWHTLSNTGVVQKSNLFKTYTFEASTEAKVYNYRCKIELTSVSQTSKPRVRNLRSIMKEV